MDNRYYQGLLGGILLMLWAIPCANANNDMTTRAILERIKPVAQVYVRQPTPAQASSAATTSKTTVKTGEAIFKTYCTACHKTGVSGAPVLGNAKDWQPRIAEGIDTLVDHAIKGYKVMPPKGTCMSCSDQEIKNAVEYMVNAVSKH
jgi:cytochrome c5